MPSPIVTPHLLMNSQQKNSVLVIAAHPDDEVLGCGGTVALHRKNGDDVCTVVVCEGSSLRGVDQGQGDDHHLFAASRELGVEDVRHLGLPDQRLDTMTLTDIITPLEEVVRDVRPNIVYCQHGGDVNIDHTILFKAALVAVRPTELYIDVVYAFEAASSTEWAHPRVFVPDTFVDISSTLEQKLRAMNCYKSELRDYPHPRSLEALRHRAHSWGNQNCLDAAEAFMTVRRIARGGRTP
jgi:LmbE family N-acetylglucosaminyl deacetylase